MLSWFFLLFLFIISYKSFHGFSKINLLIISYSIVVFHHIYIPQCAMWGQLAGAVDRAPVQESEGPVFKSHLRHLTLTSVILGKLLNPNCLNLGHLQSSS